MDETSFRVVKERERRKKRREKVRKRVEEENRRWRDVYVTFEGTTKVNSNRKRKKRREEKKGREPDGEAKVERDRERKERRRGGEAKERVRRGSYIMEVGERHGQSKQQRARPWVIIHLHQMALEPDQDH